MAISSLRYVSVILVVTLPLAVDGVSLRSASETLNWPRILGGPDRTTLQMLRESVASTDPAGMARSCAALAAPIDFETLANAHGLNQVAKGMFRSVKGLLLQGPYLDDGVEKVAVDAMRWALDNNQKDVALNCNKLLTQMVAWNPFSQAKMAKPAVGAIEVSIKALKKYGVEHSELLADDGYYRDFSFEAKREFVRLGGIEAAASIAQANHTAEAQNNWQCFVSTLCSSPDVAQQFVDMGYIEQSLKACRDFPTGHGLRGEVLNVYSSCFAHDSRYVQEYVKRGWIQEVVSILHDEASGIELDVIAPWRVYRSGMETLATLAGMSSQWQAEGLEAGAVEEVGDLLLAGKIRVESACYAFKVLTSRTGSAGDSSLQRALEQHTISSKVKDAIRAGFQDRTMLADCAALL